MLYLKKGISKETENLLNGQLAFTRKEALAAAKFPTAQRTLQRLHSAGYFDSREVNACAGESSPLDSWPSALVALLDSGIVGGDKLHFHGESLFFFISSLNFRFGNRRSAWLDAKARQGVERARVWRLRPVRCSRPSLADLAMWQYIYIIRKQVSLVVNRYLESCLIDHDLIPLKHFTEFEPEDVKRSDPSDLTGKMV